MKKSNFGLLALALGLGLVFTQSAFKAENNSKRAEFTFYYDGPSFDVADVTNEANWKYDSEANECSGINDQACTIRISDAYVDNPLTTPALKSTANLTATLRSPYNTAYVTGSADSGMSISNEAHP